MTPYVINWHTGSPSKSMHMCYSGDSCRDTWKRTLNIYLLLLWPCVCETRQGVANEISGYILKSRARQVHKDLRSKWSNARKHRSSVFIIIRNICSLFINNHKDYWLLLTYSSSYSFLFWSNREKQRCVDYGFVWLY